MKRITCITKQNIKKTAALLLSVILLLCLFPAPVQAAAKKVPISKASVTVSYTRTDYTGNTKKPSVAVKYKKKNLKRGRDFSVSYRNNKKVGKATVIIKGKGRFSGTVKKSFKIRPKATQITALSAGTNRLELQWKKQTKQTIGYELQYSPDKQFGSGTKSQLIPDKTMTKWEVTGLKPQTTYYVRLRTVQYVNNNAYYSVWSKKQTVKTAAPSPSSGTLAEKNADIALQILRDRSIKEGTVNALFSPLSLYEDLAMAANGAGSRTLSEMETFLGGDIASVNSQIATYNQNLPGSVQVANSIWINELYGAVKPDFKQQTESAYQAKIASVPYNEDTVDQINSWVSEHTKQMIPRLLNSLDPAGVMHLINAVAFEADWNTSYEPSEIRPSQFKNADGKKQDCQMLYSTEDEYLDLTDTNGKTIAYGFLKPYKDGQTAFLGLLPQADYSTQDILDQLDGAAFLAMYQNRRPYVNGSLHVGIPEFKLDDSLELTPYLLQAGVREAFTDTADFRGLLQEEADVHIDSILQKTHIEVDRNGTKAAAVTDISVVTSSAYNARQDLFIILNRPFVYAIVDLSTGMPYFMGVEAELK